MPNVNPKFSQNSKTGNDLRYGLWWFRSHFLHTLNPLTKIVATMPAIVALIFVRTMAIPLLFMGLSICVLLVGSKLTNKKLVTILLVVPTTTLLLAGSFALWTNPHAVKSTCTIFALGGYSFTDGMLIQGATTAFRLGAMIMLGLIFGMTTNATDVARSLTQQLSIPYTVSYTAIAAFGFVPKMRHDVKLIKAAHRVRGIADGSGPLPAVKQWINRIITLLIGGIRHAERLSLAMDSRAFGAYVTRTERHVLTIRKADIYFVLSCWVITLTVLNFPFG